jgi:hypothetical protein
METVRTEKRGKLTLRMLKDKVGYSGVIFSDKGRQTLLHGDDPAELWSRLEQEAAKSSNDYVGFDGARARFLHFFPAGFETPSYLDPKGERKYKVDAKQKLDATAPLDQASVGSGFSEAALAVFRATNLLSPFEMMRVTDLLRSTSANGFIRAAARFARGDGAQALAEMALLAKLHDAAKWTVVTYLPYLWRPEAHMFLKPEVTKDFAERVGHPFVHTYTPTLDMAVYNSLIDLVARTEQEIGDLHPHDRIDVQSFIWVVGAYAEADMPK